ncbi:MAG: hypothetical protein OET21_04340, partial [Desulfobacterales bacterium]|nr:hypothetical protein [Desulfobacterales bacterium]
PASCRVALSQLRAKISSLSSFNFNPMVSNEYRDRLSSTQIPIQMLIIEDIIAYALQISHS